MARAWRTAALLLAVARVAAALDCPDLTHVNVQAVAVACSSPNNAVPLPPSTCDACIDAFSSTLDPFFQSSMIDLGNAAELLRCLILPVLPRLVSAGVNVEATAQCLGLVDGNSVSSSSDEGIDVVSAFAAVMNAPSSARVNYSAACMKLSTDRGIDFSPAWLTSSVAACLPAAGACDRGCLGTVRSFTTAFVAAGCDREYFASVFDQSGAAAGALAETAFNSLLPALASPTHLPCARNAAGTYCMAFTGVLGDTGTQLAQLAAQRTSPDVSVRCAYWKRIGCCASMVTAVQLRATEALVGLSGGGGGLNHSDSWVSAAQGSAAAVRQLNDECFVAAHSSAYNSFTDMNVSVTPCGTYDAFLGGFSPAGNTSRVIWRGDKKITGGALAALVLFVLAAVAACAGVAFVVGRRKAKADVRHAFQLSEFTSSTPSTSRW